jgi:hypothetical protein
MNTHDRFKLFRDHAGAWCAAPPGFRNLLTHPIGRGRTRVEAVRDLFAHPEFVQRAELGEWPDRISFRAFVEVATPECAKREKQEIAAIPPWASVQPHTLRLIWERRP